MKKAFSLFAASALLLSLLSACGQQQGSVPSQVPSAAPTESASAAPEPSAAPDADPADGASITTNSGEVIALSALEHQSEGGSTVYYLSEITPEAMVAAYEALEWSPTGRVAVKLSTGEPPNSNYLRPELIKNVVQGVDGTIVENNTAYGGSRAETAMHYQVARDHSFNDIADVVILDENGSMSLPVEGGSNLTENLVGPISPTTTPIWCCPTSRATPWRALAGLLRTSPSAWVAGAMSWWTLEPKGQQ